ncbi:MAG: hypothetical protein HFI33_02765 [Lachnospiraceae bacterium]|nr:hypothetical protein [Lachnospiraceae bacterium]
MHLKDLGNLSNAIKIIEKSKNNFEIVSDAVANLSKNSTIAALSTTNLSNTQIKAILSSKELSNAEIETALNAIVLSASQKKASATTGGLSTAFKGLISSINPVKATLIGIIAVLVGSYMAFNKYKQHLEEIRQATEEAANTYKEHTASIDDYVSKYQELQKALVDAKGNEEETYNIKKQLLDLQIELNNKFGEEYGKINLVTNAYRDQTNVIRELNKEAAKEYLRENRKGISNSFEAMEEQHTYNLSQSGIMSDTEVGSALEKLAEKYAHLGVELEEELSNGKYSMFSIKLEADATSAYDTIFAFYEDLSNIAKESNNPELFNAALDLLSFESNKAKSIIDDNITQVTEALRSEIIIDSDLSTLYDDAIKAVDEFNEVILDSEDPFNDKKVNTARQNLADIQAFIQDNEEEWGRYSLVIDEVFDKADTKAFDFANTLRNEASIQPLIDSIRGMNELDLNILANTPDITSPAGKMAFDALNPAKKVFDDLISKAKEYGFVIDDSAKEVQKLIDLLVNLGIVQKDLSGDDTTPQIFSSFEGTQIGERLQYITSQFEEGEISFKEYFDTLNNEIANVDFSNYTNSIEEANAASQQFFTDSIQQTASGLSDLISKFDSGSIGISEYLEGYVSIANTLSTLTDELQENSASWDQNGNAMDNATSEMLDSTQVSLDNAISTIESYQDSIYSLEQIMSGAVEAGTDEFTAHTQVIAEDLANIVASGGEMADEIANTLGTTTSEIASNMSENVSNQNLAAQAIAANTNVAIMDMADSVGQLFDTLGNAISNFKVDVSFDIKKISWKVLDMGILGPRVVPKIDFGLEANGESLSAIGAAISNFGKSVSSNLASQTIDLSDFNFKGDNKYTPDADALDNYNKKLGNLKNSQKAAGKAAKDAADEAVDAINEQIDALEREKEAAEEAFQVQIDGIDDLIKEKDKQIDAIKDEIDAINDEADAIKKASEARKRDIDLQKAQYDVERAENQRTSLVYTEDKGMIYVADTEGIRDKREKVTEIQEDIEIANLQKKIDLKEDEIDIIQDEIDALEEQKDSIKEMMEESNKYYENLIKNLREEANEARKTAQETEIAARTATGGIGNAMKGLRDNGMENKSLSYYIWSDDDENALISAQGTLAELNRLINSGVDVERYTKLRDEVANFVDEYNRLKETRQVTDDFKNSLDALLGSNDIYINNFLGLVDGVEQRIETASNYSAWILEYVNKTNDAYNTLNDNLDEAKVEKTNEELNTLTNTFQDAVLKVTEETGILNGEVSNVSDTVKGTTEELQLFGINLDNSLLKATENTKLLDDITSKMSSNTGELTEKSSEGFKTVGQIMAESVQNIDDFSSSASVVANDIELLKSSMSGLDTAGETIDGVIDEEADKLTNLDESINAVSNSVSTIQNSQENINSLSEAFTTLGKAIKSVSDALGIGEEGAVSSLVEALNSISNISLSGEDGGIVSEFQNLKTAVKEVSAAVSGGDSKGVAKKSGTGTNESGASSLTNAIMELKKTTDEALGSGEEESGSGEGEGVIGKFTMLKQAVDAVTKAIGLDSEEGSGSEESVNLIGAILAQYEAVSEALPEEKLLFEDLQGLIEQCVDALNDMIVALREIQSIGVPGVSTPGHTEKKGGKAFADGYHGLPKKEKNALRSEYGQPELTVYPNGKTELTTGPVMSDLPKGTVIYNEKQTKRILSGKTKASHIISPQGTVNTGEIVLSNGQMVTPYNSENDTSLYGEISRKLATFTESINRNTLGLFSPMTEIQRDMEQMTNHVKNISNTNASQVHVENQIHVTCPGVTSQEVMKNLGSALDEKFRGFHNYADQQSRVR